MVDDAAEEKKEKKGFAKIKKIAGGLEKDHARFAAGGVTNVGPRVTQGRNMARAINQSGSNVYKKAGRGR
jgi:hypothetical protein